MKKYIQPKQRKYANGTVDAKEAESVDVFYYKNICSVMDQTVKTMITEKRYEAALSFAKSWVLTTKEAYSFTMHEDFKNQYILAKSIVEEIKSKIESLNV